MRPVAQHNSTSADRPDQSPKTFFVGRDADLSKLVCCCPYATSWHCVELATGQPAIIALPCKRWGCEYCGPRKCFQLAIRCELAKATKLITFTTWTKLYESPRDAFDQTRRKLPLMNKLIREKIGSFEYLRVLEATKAGWPHYHLVCRCKYISVGFLRNEWKRLTGNKVVDVSPIEQEEGCFRYVMKYLRKQYSVPWTQRRVTWSHGFFPKPEKKAPGQRPFINGQRVLKHPIELLKEGYDNRQVTQVGNGVWVIDGSSDLLTPRVAPVSFWSDPQWPKNKPPSNASGPSNKSSPKST